MVFAKIYVTGTCARVTELKKLTSGLAGGKILVDYDDHIWAGLSKTVVFRGIVEKDVPTGETVVEIPWEVLGKPCKRLWVGFYGTDSDKNMIIPTVYADLGPVLPGADPSGDESTDPSLPVWAQLQNQIDDLRENGSPGGGGSVEDGGYYTPSVKQPDRDTLQFNFAPSKADMPAIEPVEVTLPAGPQGNDYILTEADKKEIAEMAADLVEVPDSGGNADYFNLYTIGKKIMCNKYSKIVLMGDSITDGYGGTGYNGSQTGALSTNTEGYCWANAFKKYVESKFGITVENKGVWGTAAAAQVAQAKSYLTGTELVIWLSGTNNRISKSSYDDYVSNMGRYISDLQAVCADLVVMSCIPADKDNEKTKYVTSAEICEVIVKEATGKAFFFDMRREFARYCDFFDFTTDSTLDDGLHPNDTGYWIMFKLLCESIGIPLSTFVSYKQNSEWWGSGGNNGENVPTLVSISATYNGGNVTVGTPVSALTDIIVTAHYSDGSTKTVTGYTLSGTISEGANTVTVIYEGITTTFTVIGDAEPSGSLTLLLDAKGISTSAQSNAFDSWKDGIIPVMQMAQYDSTTNTTLFSGKNLKKISFDGDSNGFKRGTLTIGTVDLTTISKECVLENIVVKTIDENNEIVFENGFNIPNDHTLAMAAVDDTARLSYHMMGISAENYMYTKEHWLKTVLPNPFIAIVAKFYI